DDEITVLSRTFNRMTEQLQSQRNELVEANKQLDHRRRFTEAVLEGVKVGVIGLNARGEVDLPNSAALSILSESEDGLKGKPLTQAVPEISELMTKAARSPNVLVQEEITIVRQGQPRNLLVRVSPERADGRITGFVATFDDITELAAAQRTAAWADVARRIAHEIKNPLTPIQLSAERLKRKYNKEVETDPEVFSHCTDTIIRQVGDIRRMVDEFSGFARMPAPTFRPEDIRELARQTLLFLEVSSPDVTFSFDAPDEPVTVTCDGRQIAQAMTNIIKNAVESIHGRKAKDGDAAPAGKIAVSIKQEGDSVAVEVSDNGLGLPTDQRDRLTEPYVTTREKGTGLGLAIVKKIMGDHGGELVLSDRTSGGATSRLVFSHTHFEALAQLDSESAATAAE
ncbi:MAG: sensor histidine kinase, partial [Alphaproteobacteria bacterium]